MTAQAVAQILDHLDPSTLRELASVIEGQDPERRALRELTPEGVERLAEILIAGGRPTAGFWRRYRVGELVRQGQEDGTVARSHVGVVDDNTRTVTEAAGVTHRSQVTALYPMADVHPADFDAAIEDAKAEGNLSRANVVRKVML